jgi:hypothetical protein
LSQLFDVHIKYKPLVINHYLTSSIIIKFVVMIKVLRHGKTSAVRNPATGREEIMVDVVFVELGRGGANVNLSASQDFLNELEGEDVGLPGIRVHTQPILKDMVHKYPIGRTIESGFINRKMYSKPQMIQQEGRPPREIDGRPTYFVTWLGKTAQDEDLRDSNEILSKTNPELFNGTFTRATSVRVLEEAQQFGDPENVLGGDAGNPGLASAKVVANQS